MVVPEVWASSARRKRRANRSDRWVSSDAVLVDRLDEHRLARGIGEQDPGAGVGVRSQVTHAAMIPDRDYPSKRIPAYFHEVSLDGVHAGDVLAEGDHQRAP